MRPRSDISKANQVGSPIVTDSDVIESASPGGRDASSSGNDQRLGVAALAGALQMRDLRAGQPLDRSISDYSRVEAAQTSPEDGRPKSK